MPDNSFDIVSKIELPEVSNAIAQALKEVITRYDLKDSKSTIELKEKDNKILLASADDFKLKAVIEILQSKLVKRNVPIKGLQYGTLIQGSGGSVRQEITLQQGIPMEKAKDIVRVIKDSKKKAQAAIQGDLVRVSAKDRDILQEVIALLRNQDFGGRSKALSSPARPGSWKRCWRSRRKARRALPRWSAIRTRSTAARCTTKLSIVSRAGFGKLAPWCCGSTTAASISAKASTITASARRKTPAPAWSGCAHVTLTCRR
jgi:uncharacterized protein YajQ (UPF0234 family)